MKWSAGPTGLVPDGVVTRTSTVPAVPAGATAVSDVDEVTVKSVAGAVPKSTASASVNPVPVTLTVVPPAVAPLAGATPDDRRGAEVVGEGHAGQGRDGLVGGQQVGAAVPGEDEAAGSRRPTVIWNASSTVTGSACLESLGDDGGTPRASRACITRAVESGSVARVRAVLGS